MCRHTLPSAQLSTFQLVNAKLAQAQPSRPGGTAYSKVRSGQPSIAAVNSTVAVSTSTAPAPGAIFSRAPGGRGGEGVQVDKGFQRRGARGFVELFLWASPAAQTGQPGDVGGESPGQRGQRPRVAVADGGGLPGEHEPAAGLQHSKYFTQRQLDVGNVVQHSVSDH